MRYTNPRILTIVSATSTIMTQQNKLGASVDSEPLQSINSAYEADE